MALAAAYSLYCSHFGCDSVALGISISDAAIQVQINSVIKGIKKNLKLKLKHEKTDLGEKKKEDEKEGTTEIIRKKIIAELVKERDSQIDI